MKLSYEDKLDIYKLKKSGISFAQLSKKYEVRKEILKYLVRLIDLHGFKILCSKQNKSYSKDEKVRIINRVLLNGESAQSVSLLTREQELEREIEYLKAENEYLKKLEAVVLQRELKQKKK